MAPGGEYGGDSVEAKQAAAVMRVYRYGSVTVTVGCATDSRDSAVLRVHRSGGCAGYRDAARDCLDPGRAQLAAGGTARTAAGLQRQLLCDRYTRLIVARWHGHKSDQFRRFVNKLP